MVDSSLLTLLIGAIKSPEGAGLVEELASERGVGEERLVQSLNFVLIAGEGGQGVSPSTLAQAAIVRANAARVTSALCQVMPSGK